MTKIDLQPTLQDDSFLLRPLTKDDFNALYDAASDPLIWEQHPDKRNNKDVFEKFFRGAIESGYALVIIDKENHKIIGTSRYKPVAGIDTAVEIGWTFLARKYWGHTANKAVKTLMIDHAFKFFEDVILYIDRNNIRSQKAAEKIGADRQDLNSPFSLARRDENDVTYRINKYEWQNPFG